ncbi:glycine/D-amino acid oxidase-like deaminating enzyme [Kibdelosporangium banguiense]|uniref:Glycine/D-amino acid oxidase-like deaminating enzyme n=1 Tax=Kibdelosporangium banguiense TaxID=1365924 RepID=A0ABS4TUX2_9PSEU|nr:FAD-dependent oxidoreductase [Kibdelosporangium banguiense]MBP2328168.1 glycine/D-amino acid oxidase-like deaminating enzyme [Kibdelosporangium banguiense]
MSQVSISRPVTLPSGRAGSWPLSALEGSKLRPLWLDTPDRPAPRLPLIDDIETDLLVVGGGLTGLWTALRAVERNPGRQVVLIESDRIAEHAAGRNGGMCEASITHGEHNGRTRWPDEYDQLHQLGMRNLDEIEQTVSRYDIGCGFRRGGSLSVATRSHEVLKFRPDIEGFLGATATRAIVDSPTYLAGRHSPRDCSVVDPARLAWGLAKAAESQGVRIHEHTRLESLTRKGGRVLATTAGGTVRAANVVLATNVFPGPLRRPRWSVVPVYDYVLATEPLTDEQLRSLNWDPAIAVTDFGNQFHYYRITPDNRILWGGYDAVYHFGRSIRNELQDRRVTFEKLARHFAETFPQLEGIRFTHRWAGVIDASTRFAAFFGQAHGGRTAYATGFTGLGVGASRFAADVMLDQLAGLSTERTRLRMVREKPLPFPPEPIAWIGIQITRWSMDREDRTGRRNLWLRLLDRLGLGFAS